ncbi:SH3 domain-containing protein [Paracoccus albus]|uniref:SH3 domain-containing protein n=1 Tax=Paracoccus albus TaxID=3017784 RepID=UPI0022F04168|nr:SH3 domain-containing protein [Paracoccus albus]WBU60810.1 SH3 domain-containing protein [Paracoccus albus]
MFGRILCSAALAACLALPVAAESTTQPVIFAVGATGTAVSGQVVGRDTADFTLVAEAGQRMTVRMNTDNPSAYFNIYAPGDVPGESQAIYIGSTSGLSADLTLPESGTYLIRTYLMPSAGRENEAARFSLTIDVAGRTPQSNDVANSLNAEPDYWKVTGITGRLNIRSEASTGSAIAGTVANDATLRNLGCETVDDRNWCRVETTSGDALSGWAASDFLTQTTEPADSAEAPAAAPSANAAPRDNAIQPPSDITPPSQPPAAAPAAPQGTTAPADRPAVVATRPPVAPPTKIPLGGTARPAEPSATSPKPAPKPAQSNSVAPAADNAASGSLPCSTSLGCRPETAPSA